MLYCSAKLIILVISVNIIKNYFISFFIIIILLLVCSQLNNLLIKNNIFNKKISAVFSVISINLLIFILIFSIGKIIVYNINLISNHDINNMQYFLLKTSTVLGKSINKINDKINILYSSILNSTFLKYEQPILQKDY